LHSPRFTQFFYGRHHPGTLNEFFACLVQLLQAPEAASWRAKTICLRDRQQTLWSFVNLNICRVDDRTAFAVVNLGAHKVAQQTASTPYFDLIGWQLAWRIINSLGLIHNCQSLQRA
jgi:hypothetical protein